MNNSRRKAACCFFFFLIATFSTYGAAICSSLPKWYLTPPRDSEQSLMGVGEGVTAEVAAKEALNQIASKLSVTVSSAWEKSEAQSRNNGSVQHNQYISSSINAKVAALKFNNYEISESERIDGKFLVLVTVDRKKLLADKKQELWNLDYQIESLYGSHKEKQILQKIADLKAVTEKVQEAMPLVSLIVSLEPSFDGAPFYGRYNSYLAKEKEVLSEARVALSYPDDSENFARVIKEHLNNNNLAVITAHPNPDRNTMHLKVKSEFKRLQIYGSSNIKVVTLIEIKDAAGNIVASSKIESKGASMLGPDEAEKAAALDLDSKIKKTGIFKALGIHKSS